MSDIDRLFQQLVRTIQANFPAYLRQPFEVAELYQNILPYRHHRRELGLDSNQDYELALTELLSGAGGYLVIDERMRDALQKELASRNPDPGAFREFAASQVALNQDAVARVLGSAGQGPAAAPARTPTVTTTARRAAPPVAHATSAASSPSAPPPAESSAPARPILTPSPPRMSTPASAASRPQVGITPSAGDTCRYCGGALPTGRRITFCPHCGENLTVINCPACGTELDLGWKFCPTCGRPASSTST